MSGEDVIQWRWPALLVRCTASWVAWLAIFAYCMCLQESSAWSTKLYNTHRGMGFILTPIFSCIPQLQGTHVKISFAQPPDTDTPGFAEETKHKVCVRFTLTRAALSGVEEEAKMGCGPGVRQLSFRTGQLRLEAGACQWCKGC